MTDYSRSNILLPHFEEAGLLNALDGKDAHHIPDLLMMSERKDPKTCNRIYHGTI